MIEDYIKKAKAGNTGAFAFIISEYKHLVYSVILQIIQDKHLAEDVAQETFIKVYKNIKSFKGDSKFSTWIYRIAVNEALALSNKKSTFINYREEIEDSNYSYDNPDELVFFKERKQLVIEALKKLKPQESLILNLFYLQEQSIKEIATIVKLKEDHIKVVLHRARKSFYKIIQQEMKNEISILR